MKRLISLLAVMVYITICYAQSLQKLEENPSFKGITIGMPISETSNKLLFEKKVNGYSVYKVTDTYYYSVFNVRMNYVRVVALNGKVHALEAMKIVKAEKQGTIFDAKELDVIQAGLTRLYGEPKYGLNENNSKFVRVGVQWVAQTKLANCFIDFYGTFVGYKLQFSLCEYKEDF